MDEDKKDVEETVTPSEDKESVEDTESKGDDKETNLAKLRQAKEKAEKERDDALAELAKQAKNNERTLGESPEPSEESGKETKKETKKDDLSLVFQRDLKDVTRVWNKKNTVSDEEWEAIRSRVSLKGDETRSEIEEKIDEAYQSLPSVRKKREQELIELGRKQAMGETRDDEMDFTGGGDTDYGSERKVRVDSRTKNFAKRVGGLTDEDFGNIDPDENPNEWKTGKEPTRKFFQPGS